MCPQLNEGEVVPLRRGVQVRLRIVARTIEKCRLLRPSDVWKPKESNTEVDILTSGILNRLWQHFRERGPAITLGLLVPFVVHLVGAAAGFAQERSTAASSSGASSIRGQARAITGQGQTDVLMGIEVTLSGPLPSATSSSTVTGENGQFLFEQLRPGTYRLEAGPEGFQPWVAMVTLGQGEASSQDIVLHIRSSVQGLEVHGDASEISTESTETTAALNEQVLNSLPLAQRNSPTLCL